MKDLAPASTTTTSDYSKIDLDEVVQDFLLHKNDTGNFKYIPRIKLKQT
jgi:hypothetical protein